mgnify:CR=1 FL=1
MKILFWGTPHFSVPTLDYLIRNGHSISAVITQPDKKRGRGGSIICSPVKYKAIENGIKVLCPANISKDISFQAQLNDIKYDISIVIAFGQILPKNILEQPKYGSWNCHASLLPRWRGAAPIQWSILSGDSSTGIGIMSMEEGLDTGPVILEKKTDIHPLENSKSLSDRLSIIAANLTISALKKIESNNFNNTINNLIIKDQKQYKDKVTYARMIKKMDNLINWDNSCIEIHRKIMGLYPNAYTFIGNKRLKILESIPITEDYKDFFNSYETKVMKLISTSGKAGTIKGFINDSGIIISTIDSNILIKKIKIEGKASSKGKRMIQQLNLSEGTILGKI